MKYSTTCIAVLLFGSAFPYAPSHASPDATVAASVISARPAATMDMLSTIPRDERIVLKATSPVAHRVTVFTDVECTYCRKFHAQVEQYLRAGIEIQYLFYPRAGRHSLAFAKAVAVWCAKDRLATLALAFDDGAIPQWDCDNPVAKHYELAIRMGLLGTPALITEDGDVMYGAPPVSRLLGRLGARRFLQ